MIAELKIYEDCSSPEPTKTYPLYRVTTRVTKQLADFQVKSEEGMGTDEAMEELRFVFKTIFPKITDEELDCVSIEEMMDFVWAVVNHFNNVSGKNLKN